MFAVLGLLAAVKVTSMACDYFHNLANIRRRQKGSKKLDAMCLEATDMGIPVNIHVVQPKPRLYLSDMEFAIGEGRPELYESAYGKAHGVGVANLVQGAAHAEARFKQLEASIPHCPACGQTKLEAA